MKNVDVLIVGAGLTGLTLAIALADLGLQIAVTEAALPSDLRADSSSQQEMRALALSYSSQQIFARFGFWKDLIPHATPIKHVHVSDRGYFGFTRIHASDYQLPCLGSVVSMQVLQQQLIDKIKTLSNIQLLQPALVENTFIEQQKRAVQLSTGLTLSCALVIAADGSHSKLRDMLGLNIKKFDYQQTAIAANVTVDRPHDNTAYERFTASGPLALLPVGTSGFSLVWTLKSEMATEISQLPDREFLKRLQQAFGYRVGRFTGVGARQCFPLALIQAESFVAERAVIIGNAAHTLHPVGGQGFNLGLRDVNTLFEEIQLSKAGDTKTDDTKADDIGTEASLKRYASRRQSDYAATIGLTDRLVKAFSTDFLPLRLLRNLALLGIDSTPLKHPLAKRMMGNIYNH